MDNRPEVGKTYINRGGNLTVEVRAVCESHVVCDDEQVFTRFLFDREFRQVVEREGRLSQEDGARFPASPAPASFVVEPHGHKSAEQSG